MVIPSALLEPFVDSASSASPSPAGDGAPVAPRYALALVSAWLGAAAGLFIARRISRFQRGQSDRSNRAPGPRRPLHATEELGGINLFDDVDLRFAPHRTEAVAEPIQSVGDIGGAWPSGCRDEGAPQTVADLAPILSRPAGEPRAVGPSSLDNLDLGQLVEHLAAAIDRRRAAPAGPSPVFSTRLPDPVARPESPGDHSASTVTPFNRREGVAAFAPGVAQADAELALRAALATLRRVSGNP